MAAACFTDGSPHHGKEPEKAVKYIVSLYEARCNGQWGEISERARKVEKYAPSRKYLTVAAKAGALVETKPTVEGATAVDRDYGEALQAAVQDTAATPEDALDAAVTRATIYYFMQAPEAALELLAVPPIKKAAQPLGTGGGGWMTATVMKGTLIRGLSLERTGRRQDAAATYRPVIAYISRVATLPSMTPEVRRWAEELTSHISLFFSERGQGSGQFTSLGEAMASFHVLSQLVGPQSFRFSPKTGMFTRVSPRQIWRTYYAALSTILREDLVYHPSPLSRDHESLEHRGLLDDADFDAARRQQRIELRRVETNYERLLLEEIRFPKANESNAEIKEWIEAVMSNWHVLCGPQWTDEEVGPGGKVSVARSSLDILYRAATKTFHSTQILRHLFTVHTYLGEFDLAFKAFDTYADIITKGRARIEKSGGAGLDIDDSATAFKTAAEAVRVACRYGSKQMAEKALQISAVIEKWLVSNSSETVNSHGDVEKTVIKAALPKSSVDLPPAVLAVAYRAIGISQANWSRTTFDAEMRSTAQRRAVETLQGALDQGVPDSDATETLYALGLCLAETRDVGAAVDLVKRALKNPVEAEKLASPEGVIASQNTSGTDESARVFARLRKALPLWHLLSQLLSSYEEFDTATAACDTAFDQLAEYIDLEKVFSADDYSVSEKTDDSSRKYSASVLDPYEKQVVVELKMTQIALLEVTEGVESAVNASNELLALYASLFGSVSLNRNGLPKTSLSVEHPRGPKDVVRQMFSRPTTARNSISRGRVEPSVNSHTPKASRPATIDEEAPSIQITNEDGTIAGDKSINGTGNGLTKTRSLDAPKKSLSIRQKATGSMLGKKSAASRPSTAHDDNASSIDARQFDEKLATGEHGLSQHTQPQTLPKIPHNLDHRKEPPPMGHTHQPPRQDTRLPVPPPDMLSGPLMPQFLTVQQSRHKTSTLVSVWLFVARLFLNALLFEDAKEAIDEAQALVEGFEQEVSKYDSSLKAFQRDGWGGGKSVEELWADVYSQRGRLNQAQDRPHDAMWCYDQALLHYPDHDQAIPGISAILLDIYSEVIYPQNSALDPSAMKRLAERAKPLTSQSSLSNSDAENLQHAHLPSKNTDPIELYRLAGRDRAYGLLSALTKLGTGWDDSEAWILLARAYEESGQIDKAKEALWWTVELEETKPIRAWRHTGPGGYVL